jgi:hypothetical protein
VIKTEGDRDRGTRIWIGMTTGSSTRTEIGAKIKARSAAETTMRTWVGTGADQERGREERGRVGRREKERERKREREGEGERRVLGGGKGKSEEHANGGDVVFSVIFVISYIIIDSDF